MKVKRTGILFHGLDAWGERSFWVVVVDSDKKDEFLRTYTQTEWDKSEEVFVDFPEKYNTCEIFGSRDEVPVEFPEVHVVSEKLINVRRILDECLGIMDGHKAATARKQDHGTFDFDEQSFIEKYCPMEGGNDYLGWIDDIYKLLNGENEPGDAASTGDYADMSEDELRKELKRLTAIVLHQAVDRYVEMNY